MPSQAEKAQIFKKLHIKGHPVILYNVWDAGSARAVAQAGAKAIATGSHSVAEAQGYDDGQEIPLNTALEICSRIVGAVDLPVTVDFEGAYAVDESGIAANVTRLLETGAIGLNFEDQVVGGKGLYSPEMQAKRIAAIRRSCDAKAIPAVINARTDLFLKEPDATKHASLIEEAVSRARIYEQAGADCFFVPLLSNPELIADICKRVNLPVNIIIRDTEADISPFVIAGVSRISFGPYPYKTAMKSITDTARKYFVN